MSNFLDIYLDSTSETNAKKIDIDEINLYTESIYSPDYNADIIECKLAMFEFQNHIQLIDDSYTYYAEAVGGFVMALIAFIKKGFAFLLKMLLGLKGLLVVAILGGIGYLIYRLTKGDKIETSGGGGGGGGSSSPKKSEQSKEIPKEDDIKVKESKGLKSVGRYINIAPDGINRTAKAIQSKNMNRDTSKEIKKFNAVLDSIGTSAKEFKINTNRDFSTFDKTDIAKLKAADKVLNGSNIKKIINEVVKADATDIPGSTIIEKSAYELIYEELRDMIHGDKVSPSTGKTYSQLLKENPVDMLDGDFEEVTDNLVSLFGNYEVTAAIGARSLEKTAGTFVVDVVANAHKYLTLALCINSTISTLLYNEISDDENERKTVAIANAKMTAELLSSFDDKVAKQISQDILEFNGNDDEGAIKNKKSKKKIIKMANDSMSDSVLGILKRNIFAPKNTDVIVKASNALKRIKFKKMTDPKDITLSYLDIENKNVLLVSKYDRYGMYELYTELYSAAGDWLKDYKKLANDVKNITTKIAGFGEKIDGLLDLTIKHANKGKSGVTEGANFLKSAMMISVASSSTVFDSINIFNTAIGTYRTSKIFDIINEDIASLIAAKMITISNSFNADRAVYHDNKKGGK